MNKDIIILKEKLSTNLYILQKNIIDVIFNDFNILFEKVLKNNKQKKFLLKEFQDKMTKFINEKKFIDKYIENKKCKSIIHNIFQIYINLYNTINKKFNYVSIPIIEDYILECYKIYGRQIWKEPHLYHRLDKNDSRNKLYKMIKKAIEESFSNLLSFDNYEESSNSENESENSYEEEEQSEDENEIIKDNNLTNLNDIDNRVSNETQSLYGQEIREDSTLDIGNDTIEERLNSDDQDEDDVIENCNGESEDEIQLPILDNNSEDKEFIIEHSTFTPKENEFQLTNDEKELLDHFNNKEENDNQTEISSIHHKEEDIADSEYEIDDNIEEVNDEPKELINEKQDDNEKIIDIPDNSLIIAQTHTEEHDTSILEEEKINDSLDQLLYNSKKYDEYNKKKEKRKKEKVINIKKHSKKSNKEHNYREIMDVINKKKKEINKINFFNNKI